MPVRRICFEEPGWPPAYSDAYWGAGPQSALATAVASGFSSFHSRAHISFTKSHRNRTPAYRLGKNETKLSLFAGDIILQVENPKDSTKKND